MNRQIADDYDVFRESDSMASRRLGQILVTRTYFGGPTLGHSRGAEEESRRNYWPSRTPVRRGERDANHRSAGRAMGHGGRQFERNQHSAKST